MSHVSKAFCLSALREGQVSACVSTYQVLGINLHALAHIKSRAGLYVPKLGIICACLPVLRADCVTLCAGLYQRLSVYFHVSSRIRRLSVHQHVFAHIRSLTCICTPIVCTC